MVYLGRLLARYIRHEALDTPDAQSGLPDFQELGHSFLEGCSNAFRCLEPDWFLRLAVHYWRAFLDLS